MTKINEPIWKEDIQAQRDDVEALWKTQYGYLQKLEDQDAPESLLDKVTEVNNLLSQAHAKLGQLIPFFPEQPPG